MPEAETEWGEIRGHEAAKRALEIAAAGGHSVLIVGPPRSGKTMLARSLSGLLPPLAPEEERELQELGLSPRDGRPVRTPGSEAAPSDMVGTEETLGEVTRAHRGVLLLDEIRAFRPSTLISVLRPLEDGEVETVSGNGRVKRPARFLLVATLEYPPAFEISDAFACLARGDTIPSPPRVFRERLELRAHVEPPSGKEFLSAPPETTAEAASRVRDARSFQAERFGTSLRTNAQMSDQEIKRHCKLDRGAKAFLERVKKEYPLPEEGMQTVWRIARTAADLGRSEPVRANHLAEAFSHRVNDFFERILEGEE